MTPNHVKQRLRAHRRMAEGWNQRDLVSAAQAARAAVKTDR